MKTTRGKTKSRKPNRRIGIYHAETQTSLKLIDIRNASSLTQALREFAKDRKLELSSVVGNVLVIKDGDQRRTLIAKEYRDS